LFSQAIFAQKLPKQKNLEAKREKQQQENLKQKIALLFAEKKRKGMS